MELRLIALDVGDVGDVGDVPDVADVVDVVAVARLARMVPMMPSGRPDDRPDDRADDRADRGARLRGRDIGHDTRHDTGHDTGLEAWDETDHGPASFDDFVAARAGTLLSYAHLLTGQRASAEDLVQSALVRTLSSWSRVRNKGNPEGYVRRTMARLQINTWRGRGRHPEVLVPVLLDTDPDGAPGVRPGDYDERDAMWAALATLPARQRAVLVLRYYEDLSEADIADVLGCSRGTVKSQASKGLQRLRLALADTPADTPADTQDTSPEVGR
jgi:RNA polymerase sigma-70 factor (sigma-E family)